MIYKTPLFLPEELEKNTEKILKYYKSEISFEEAKGHIYGGEDLTTVISKIGFEIVDLENLIVNIYLYNTNNVITKINNVSFRQLTVESSNNFSSNPMKKWADLKAQERLEICQQELSRWSVVLKSEKLNLLQIDNDDLFEQIELINNCTTSEGFELKIKSNGINYHASFEMPWKIYNPLCEQQAGSEAKQGWFADWDNGQNHNLEPDHGLIDTTSYPNIQSNPTFGQIYREPEHHSREAIRVDLSKYRTIDSSCSEGSIDINLGGINYNRWDHSLGSNNEYSAKPKIRKLIISPSNIEYIEAPKTYSEILSGTYQFRLPEFQPNGIYDITKPTEKKDYNLLLNFNKFKINNLTNGNFELILQNNSSNSKDIDQIIVGNIDIKNIPFYPEIQTIDRFCFAPRKTNSDYIPGWIPPSIKDKKQTIYSFLLTSNNSFIQPESWGLERMILSMNEDKTLTIDLMSYERILPIWQGTIDPKEKELS